MKAIYLLAALNIITLFLEESIPADGSDIITDTSRMTQGEDNFYKKEAFIQEVFITIKGIR